MADELVERAQRFVNETYGSVIGMTVDEDGKTGWNTMYALTRALQYELGITALSDTFGPTTLSTLTSKYPKLNGSTVPSANFCRIIQSGLYCKGYDGGEIDGTYNSRVEAAVTNLKSDMGVAGVYTGSDVTPKVFKALLNMDPYVLVDYGDSAGSAGIRSIQQWLNGRYVNRADFFIIPCDGHHSRDVAKSMLYAIQYETGLADGVANGVFGPATQAGIKAHTLTVGSSGAWVSLYSAALILNQRTGTVFSSSYTSALAAETTSFQAYVGLPQTANADFPTWASLLVSYGDQSRPGTACDCVTTVTAERATALKAAGYKYVGRYLSNVPNTTLDKVIKPGELATIADAGLSCFPIYQTWGGSNAYFNYPQGTYDAYDAIEWAKYHGFKDGTRIYFAVDYDALDADVTDYVLPHFRGIYRVIQENSRYLVGIYGPRNVCSRAMVAGYADASFVSDMSSGFSGNLGYPLSNNWAFDQIATVAVGSGTGSIEIDKNVASGRDVGQNTFDPSSYTDGLDTEFDDTYRDAMLQEVRGYLESIGVPETGGDGWTDSDWATLGGISNSEAFDLVVGADWLFTSLARQLKLRKALIQAPVLWELRKFNPLDPVADLAVQNGLKDDCSTGWGQIFGWVAIEARNYCVQQGIINGTLLVPGTAGNLTDVWTQLHDDPVYNVKTAAYLTIYNAYQIGLSRPGLDTSDADSQAILARYNGTNDAAQEYGRQVGGLYQVLEKYYKIVRNL